MSLPEYLAARNEAAYQRRCARAVDALNTAMAADDRKALEQLLRGSETRGAAVAKRTATTTATMSVPAGKTMIADSPSGNPPFRFPPPRLAEVIDLCLLCCEGLTTPRTPTTGGDQLDFKSGAPTDFGLRSVIYTESVARLRSKTAALCGAVVLLNLDSDHSTDERVLALITKARARLRRITLLDEYFDKCLTAPEHIGCFEDALKKAEQNSYQPPEIIAKLKALEAKVVGVMRTSARACKSFVFTLAVLCCGVV